MAKSFLFFPYGGHCDIFPGEKRTSGKILMRKHQAAKALDHWNGGGGWSNRSSCHKLPIQIKSIHPLIQTDQTISKPSFLDDLF